MPQHKLVLNENILGTKGNGNPCPFMSLPFQEKNDRTMGLTKNSNSDMSSVDCKRQTDCCSSLQERLPDPLTTPKELNETTSSKSTSHCQAEHKPSETCNLYRTPGGLEYQQKPLHIVWPHRW